MLLLIHPESQRGADPSAAYSSSSSPVCWLLSILSVALLRDEQSFRVSLQHGVQLVSQVIKHVADVIQDIACCLHCAAATVKQTGPCYKPADTV